MHFLFYKPPVGEFASRASKETVARSTEERHAATIQFQRDMEDLDRRLRRIARR